VKILHVITTINRGGAENHLRDLIHGQIAHHGFEVACAWLKGDSYWATALGQLGVRLFPLNLVRYGQLKPAWLLYRAIREFKPDVVHAHMPPAEFYARLALLSSSCKKPKLIISKHNDEPFYRGPGHQLLGRWVARMSSHVIAISDAVNEYMVKQLGLSTAKISTIHYGIDPTPFQEVSQETIRAVRESWEIPPQAWVIGTVARLVPQKALHILLQGYSRYRVLASRPSRLVIVGSGDLEADLKAEAQRLGVDDYVVWAGYREDIPAVMRAFDCFALTSIYEGLGLVLLEAMAAGKPVVATSVSAIPEVVQDRVTGLLCAVNNPDLIAEALLQLEQLEYQKSLGYAGYIRVTKHFSLSEMISKTIATYQESL